MTHKTPDQFREAKTETGSIRAHLCPSASLSGAIPLHLCVPTSDTRHPTPVLRLPRSASRGAARPMIEQIRHGFQFTGHDSRFTV